MASYRCPTCGATHKQEPVRCRLCGQDMTPDAVMPVNVGGRPSTARNSGLGAVALIAVGGVVAISLLAVVFGLTGSHDFLENIRDQIPGLKGNGGDGWVAIDDGDAQLTASLPENHERRFLAGFPYAANGRVEQWVAPIGEETVLTISYVALPPGPDLGTVEALERYSNAWAQMIGGSVDESREASFRGSKALDVTIDGLKLPPEPDPEAQPATTRTMLFVRGERLFVIESESIYPDQPQFARLANSVVFTR
jgi:hypothetical protein